MDSRGIMYFANQGGVLQYDGVGWRITLIPNWVVRSLAVDKNDTVYVGGKDELGLLVPGENGILGYRSLLGKLEPGYKKFGNIWKTYVTGDGVYFQATRALFRWKDGKMTVWKPKGKKFNISFHCGGILYTRQHGIGLMAMDLDKRTGDSPASPDDFKLVPGGETFAKTVIFMMVPYDDNQKEFLIGTKTGGFFIFDGRGVSPFNTEAGEYVKKNRLYHGARLNVYSSSLKGEPAVFAAATYNGGLVIFDANGKIKNVFDKTTGILDDDIKYVFEDTGGNLWLALNKGISKIEYNSPFSFFDARLNINGIGLSVTRHGPQGRLYAGTTEGLSVLDPVEGAFSPVPGVTVSCWSLLSVNDSLLAGTSKGIAVIKGDSVESLEMRPTYVLMRSLKDKERVWAGTRSGLVSITRGENGWKIEKQYKNTGKDIHSIVEDKDGNLWLGSSSLGVLHVEFSPGKEPAVTRYDTSHGLASGWVQVAFVGGQTVFSTYKGIFRFDEGAQRFLPDMRLGKEYAGGPDGTPVFLITEDPAGHIWFHSKSRNMKAIPRGDGKVEIEKTPFLRLVKGQVNYIYHDTRAHGTWFANVDGLFRFDTRLKKRYDVPFPVNIRRVTADEQAVYSGNEIKRPIDDKAGAQSKEPPTGKPVIAYDDRNLRFEFAAPFFEGQDQTLYKYFLEGYDDNWPEPTKNTYKEYTNLDGGAYRFRVRAINTYGKESREAVFSFKVLPPWYKTWWAIVLYVALFFISLFLAVKWRSRKLEREKEKLEGVVKDRTKEIAEKNQQLESQTLQLMDQSEKLKEMDKTKSRFFANISHEFRTPLTLIMGPVEQMLTASKKADERRRLTLMLRNSQRLLRLINQLLELSRFESGSARLNARAHNLDNFLKGLIDSFQAIATRKELELIYQTGETSITLSFDLEKFELVIFNLLSNAIKFTPAGGRVSLEVKEQAGEYVSISVSDTGPGIPRWQLKHVFERFYQADSTYEQHREGSGIGLAIVKEIVELHNGSIDVHSHQGENSGTEFFIKLPTIKLPAGQVPAIKESVEETGDEPVAAGLLVPDDAALGGAEDGAEEAIDWHSETKEEDGEEKNIILVVEDSADVREYIAGALSHLYTVVLAKDGNEGLAKAREIIPDLIISDVMMPGIDGYQLCGQLKKDIETSHIPLILLTAKASEQSVIDGLETGADDYLTKPFSTKILCARIKNLIDLRRQLHQSFNREMTRQPVDIKLSNMDKKFIKKMKEVLKEYALDEEFTIEVLAEKMDLSQSTLYRKIRALTGESPSEFIRSYRLKRAAELLESNFGSVLEVAVEVGFSSANYFTKCFKQKFHQLPSSYKASREHEKGGVD